MKSLRFIVKLPRAKVTPVSKLVNQLNLDEKTKIVAYAQHSWQSTCSRTGAIGSTRRGRRTVRQWLAFTTIHLLLNAPDYVLRLVNVMRST